MVTVEFNGIKNSERNLEGKERVKEKPWITKEVINLIDTRRKFNDKYISESGKLNIQLNKKSRQVKIILYDR